MKEMTSLSINNENYEIVDAKARTNNIQTNNKINDDVSELNNKIDYNVSVINNKIDNNTSMINNQINSMNETIKSTLSNISSGTPLIVNSMNEMTDTSRIYVNTTNGHWYYYSGEWIDGGVYQSTEIDNGSIEYKQLDDKLKTSLNPITNLPVNDIEFNVGKYLFRDGSIFDINNAYTGIIKKNVNHGDILKIDLQFDPFMYTNTGSFIVYGFFNSNDEMISSKEITRTEKFNEYHETNVVVPKEASYIMANVGQEYSTGFGYNIQTIKSFEQSEPIKYDNLSEQLKSLISVNYNDEIPGEILIQNAMFTNRYQLSKLDKYNVKKYTIEPNTYYLLKNAYHGYNNIIYAFGSEQGNATQLIDEVEYSYKRLVEGKTQSGAEVISDEYFKSPSYATTLYVNTSNANKDTIKLFKYSLEISKEQKLQNKKIIYEGDSITESRFTGEKANGGAYPKIIADYTKSQYVNQAVSGGTIASVVGTEYVNTHSVYDSLMNLPSDGDIYCFSGGINDYWKGLELGTFTDSYTNELNYNTVCGALEGIFRHCISNFVGKHICFILTHKCSNTTTTKNSTGKTYQEYHDAILEICKKYSIPVYDAFNESGLNGWNSVVSQTYLFNDGTHPNEEGYKKYYVPQIINLFNSMIIE